MDKNGQFRILYKEEICDTYRSLCIVRTLASSLDGGRQEMHISVRRGILLESGHLKD
jgi:hypothetical protein